MGRRGESVFERIGKALLFNLPILLSAKEYFKEAERKGRQQWLTFPFPFVHSPSFSEHIFVEDRIKDYQPVETRTQKDFGIFLMVFFFVSRLLSFGPLQRNVKKINKEIPIAASTFFFAKPVQSPLYFKPKKPFKIIWRRE